MNKNPNNLVIFVGGHNHAGKSTIIAAINKVLRDHGIATSQLVSRIDDRDQINILAEDAAFLDSNLHKMEEAGVSVETVELTTTETAQLLESLHLIPREDLATETMRVTSSFEYHRLNQAND